MRSRDVTRRAARPGGDVKRTIIWPLGICIRPAMVLVCDRACDQWCAKEAPTRAGQPPAGSKTR